jgi:molybdate transport system substrate-binding protein
MMTAEGEIPQQTPPRTPHSGWLAGHIPRLALLVVLLILVSALNACGDATPNGTSDHIALNVFAAPALQSALKEIGPKFQQAHKNVTVQYSFVDAQHEAQQINQGAAVDVFIPDSEAQMDVVVQSGKVDASTSKALVRALLVVILPKNNPAKITDLQNLASDGVKLVLAAPSLPAGQFATDFLTKASDDPSFGSGYKARVLDNVISYEQSVASVISKVSSGQADAGIVYKTDTIASASKLSLLSIPANLQTVATYPVAPIKGSKNAGTAHDFINYLMTDTDVHEIFVKDGFVPIQNFAALPGPALAERTPLRLA